MGGAFAQTPSALPQPLPKEQFDALVEAVKKAVADELKAQGASNAAAKPGTASPAATQEPSRPDVYGTFRQRLRQIIEAMPQANMAAKGLSRALDESAAGGRGTWSFLTLLLAVMVAGVAVETVVRAALSPLKSRLGQNALPEKGMRSLTYLGLLALLDGIAVVGLWITTEFALSQLFPQTGLQNRFAHGAITVLLIWRLNALALRLVFRPDLAAARLCVLDDHAARHLYRSIVSIMLLFIFLRFLSTQLVPFAPSDSAIAASRLIFIPIVVAIPIWLIVRVKTAVQQWLGDLGRTARFAGYVGRHWLGIAIPLIVAATVTQLYGIITDHLNVPTALALTLNLLVGLLLFETLLQAFVRRLDSQLSGFTPAGGAPTLADVMARCVRVAVLIGVIVAIGESWVVNVLGLVNADAWDRVTSQSRTAGITLFAAYVLWEIFKYGTESYLHRHTAGGDASTATRLHTLIPLLRVTVAIMLAVVAVLIALENIGVNVTPLLAGASVLGLALSFGSQTLVRDIVSGVFYLTDDAFRVGEFIDSEKAKGTVEGFTLRSVRLRDQSGKLHTVPFGELGRVTNHSRDWTAVDFSLNFPRTIDLDKLRQATDKVSGDIMAVPELKQVLLEPLKMQGIAEVADNALSIRFKFVTRPGDAGKVQQEAVSRLLRTLPELGIEFAT